MTGHQSLAKRLREQGARESELAAWNWVEEQFQTFLNVQTQPIVVISSLAKGADQRLSRVALAHGAKIVAVIPAHGIVKTFQTEEDKSSYNALLARAAMTEQLDNPEANEAAYYQAGKWTVDHADTLIAVWDGKVAEGLGGTGDIVACALANGKDVLQINPIQRIVENLQKGS